MNPETFRAQIRELVRALGVLDERRTPCGLPISVRDAYALHAIAAAEAAGTPLSQGQLQEALGVDKSNVTRTVQSLVAEGRVEQQPGRADARVRTLHLTAKGRRLASSLEERSAQRFRAVLALIPSSERATVLQSLQTLREALDAMEEP